MSHSQVSPLSGHVGVSGVQAHSIGATFPFSVVIGTDSIGDYCAPIDYRKRARKFPRFYYGTVPGTFKRAHRSAERCAVFLLSAQEAERRAIAFAEKQIDKRRALQREAERYYPRNGRRWRARLARRERAERRAIAFAERATARRERVQNALAKYAQKQEAERPPVTISAEREARRLSRSVPFPNGEAERAPVENPPFRLPDNPGATYRPDYRAPAPNYSGAPVPVGADRPNGFDYRAFPEIGFCRKPPAELWQGFQTEVWTGASWRAVCFGRPDQELYPFRDLSAKPF